MKTTILAFVFLVVTATACHGQVSAETQRKLQDYRDKMAEDGRAAQKRALDKKAAYSKAIDSGRSLFGMDDRWTEQRGDYAGTLLGKAPADFKVGDWGCTAVPFQVLSKVSQTECLILPKDTGANAILVRGLDTSKVTDGVEFILQRPVLIEGTFSYTAVSGGKKTVLVLDCDPKKLDEFFAKEREKVKAARLTAADALFRTWRDGDETLVARFIEFKSNHVHLKRKADGTQIEIPLSRLSSDDQKWVQNEIKRRSEARNKGSARDQVLAARAETEPLMDANGLTELEREYVATYVNNFGKRPAKFEGEINVERVNGVLFSDEVKHWVAKEIKYQKEKKTPSRKRR